MTTASVIVPCYNAETTLPAALESLARQHWNQPWEVVVADNGSTDRSRGVAESYARRLPLRVVDASDRRGQAHALNVGARAATGRFLLFCDADDEVGAGWLAAMGDGLRRSDAVAARWDIERLNSPWLQQSRGNPQATGLQRWTHPPFLPHAGGGSLGLRRSVYETVGDFDEMLAIVHDTDYCWRLQLAGFRIAFVPQAVVHIRFRATRRELLRQALDYGRAEVSLYARYRDRGMTSFRLKDSLRAWALLGLRLPRLLRAGARERWLWKLGYRIGRIAGSVHHGTLAL